MKTKNAGPAWPRIMTHTLTCDADTLCVDNQNSTFDPLKPCPQLLLRLLHINQLTEPEGEGHDHAAPTDDTDQ